MDPNTVIIEHCVKCEDHAWCTNHVEQKYLNYCEKVKLCLEAFSSELRIEVNSHASAIKSILSSQSQSSLHMRYNVPRMGSFEVYFRSKVIFSKLKSGRWPNALRIAEDIQNVIKGIVPLNDNSTSVVRPSTSNMRKSRSVNALGHVRVSSSPKLK